MREATERCGPGGKYRRVRLWCALSVTAALESDLAAAQLPTNHLYDRWQLSGSGTLLVLGATLRVDGENRGTEVSVEDDLGLSRTTLQPRVGLRWRPGKRHEIEAAYQWASRSTRNVLTDTIVFRDQEFASGLRVETSLGTSQASLIYRFAFTAKEKTQLGMALGLGAILMRSELDAVADTTTGGPDTAIVEFSRGGNFNGPTGSLGLYGRFQLGDRWYLESDLRAIYFKISNFRAGVLEAGVAGRYFISERIGAELGFGFGLYSVRLDREGTGDGFAGIDLIGRFRYTVSGLRGGVVVAF